MQHGIGGSVMWNLECINNAIRKNALDTSQSDKLVRCTVDENFRRNKWLCNIARNNGKEYYIMSGVTNSMITNEVKQQSPHDCDTARIEHIYRDLEFYDDVNGGKSLNKEIAIGARKLEL